MNSPHLCSRTKAHSSTYSLSMVYDFAGPHGQNWFGIGVKMPPLHSCRCDRHKVLRECRTGSENKEDQSEMKHWTESSGMIHGRFNLTLREDSNRSSREMRDRRCVTSMIGNRQGKSPFSLDGYLSWMSLGPLWVPEVEAGCGKAARPVLCGGRIAICVPTAIPYLLRQSPECERKIATR
jgi:hypothetical protein